MIEPTGYRVRCDHVYGGPGRCEATIERDSVFGSIGLFATMDRTRWQRGVKSNGEQAERGGKDYCPAHRRGDPK